MTSEMEAHPPGNCTCVSEEFQHASMPGKKKAEQNLGNYYYICYRFQVPECCFQYAILYTKTVASGVNLGKR